MKSQRFFRGRVLCLGSALSFGLALFSDACTMTTFDRNACKTSQECREAFGVDQVCSESGFCEQMGPLPERCSDLANSVGPYPKDLFTNPDFKDAFVLGGMFDFTLTDQVARANSMKIAFLDANEDPDGLEGRKFGIVFCDVTPKDIPNDKAAPYADNLSEEDAARLGARYLVNNLGVPVLLGPSASADVNVVWKEVVQTSTTGTLEITPGATLVVFAGLESGPFTDETPGRLWRTSVSEAVNARVIARDMKERNARTILGIGESVRAPGTFDVIQQTLLDEGGPDFIVRQIVYKSASNPDFTRAINEEAPNPQNSEGVEEVLFISGQTTENVSFVQAVNDIPGYAGKKLFFTVAGTNSAFLENSAKALGAKAAGVFGDIGSPPDHRFRAARLAPPTASATYTAFLNRYKRLYDDDPSTYSFTQQSFDAGWLAIYGVTWAFYQENRKVTGTGVGRGLRRLSSGDAVNIGDLGWTVVRSQFRGGQSVNIVGASGNLDYAPDTEEIEQAAIEVYTTEPKPGGGWQLKLLYTTPEN